MGAVHEATCPCGFSGRVKVGGGMFNFPEYWPFPFYCKRCGLVEVNTAKSTPANPTKPVCPKCGDADINQYGLPPVSEISPSKNPALSTWLGIDSCTRNFCPACKKMTLVFHSPSIFFD